MLVLKYLEAMRIAGNLPNKLGKESADLLLVQENLLGLAENIDVVLRQEIREAFKENNLRDAVAEIDDYKILTASGMLVASAQNLKNKSNRLMRLSQAIAGYGPVALPAFCSVNTLLYSINKGLKHQLNGAVESLQSSCGIKFMDGWRKTEITLEVSIITIGKLFLK